MTDQYEVNYKDGRGWRPVAHATMRMRLSGVYSDVNAVIRLMSEEVGTFEADTGFALYRRNPQYGVEAA